MCLRKPPKNITKIEPGTKFEFLTVLYELPRHVTPSGFKVRIFQCRCACGTEKPIPLGALRHNRTKTCGSRTCPVGEKLAADTAKIKATSNQHRCFCHYRSEARRRGRVFDLTEQEFVTLTQQNCHYCGAGPANQYTSKRGNTKNPQRAVPFIYSGIDRVDSTGGYTLDNCAPCCRACNRAKSDMTITEFRQWAARLAAHLAAR